MHGATRAVSKLGGSASIARRLIGQRRFAYLPPEQLAERRDRNVRSIVRYAAATTPFYRDWFREHGVDPREIRRADDLVRLPIIDKAVLQRSSSGCRRLTEGRAAFGCRRAARRGCH